MRTTEQMKSAPRGAVFVWCTENLAYPRALAAHLGRQDLELRTPSWCTTGLWGRKPCAVVLDHATRLSPAGMQALAAFAVRDSGRGALQFTGRLSFQEAAR